MESLPDFLHRVGRKVKRGYSKARWEVRSRSSSRLELHLKDALEIPISAGKNGCSSLLHGLLHQGQCTFLYEKRGEKTHKYSIRAELSLGYESSWYQFSLLFTDSEERPSYEVCELEKRVRRFVYVTIPEQHRTRAMWAGERLFWALNSESGIRSCIQLEHSPTQLFDIWWEMVIHPWLDDSVTSESNPVPLTGEKEP